MVRKKTKLMLYSTLVEIEVEVGVELGNITSIRYHHNTELAAIHFCYVSNIYIYM